MVIYQFNGVTYDQISATLIDRGITFKEIAEPKKVTDRFYRCHWIDLSSETDRNQFRLALERQPLHVRVRGNARKGFTLYYYAGYKIEKVEDLDGITGELKDGLIRERTIVTLNAQIPSDLEIKIHK